jgi:hypothetical protein
LSVQKLEKRKRTSPQLASPGCAAAGKSKKKKKGMSLLEKREKTTKKEREQKKGRREKKRVFSFELKVSFQLETTSKTRGVR